MAAACPTIWRERLEPAYVWAPSDLFFLANLRCTHCKGSGHSWRHGQRACHCVFRAIFRACFRKWLCIQREPRTLSAISMDRFGQGRSRGFTFGRKREEYAADFCLVSRRTLSDNPLQSTIFELHFLASAGWRECCRALRIDRGSFFHEVYKIEVRLGKVFRALRPYALHPVEEYFGGSRLAIAGQAIQKGF